MRQVAPKYDALNKTSYVGVGARRQNPPFGAGTPCTKGGNTAHHSGNTAHHQWEHRAPAAGTLCTDSKTMKSSVVTSRFSIIVLKLQYICTTITPGSRETLILT